MNTDCLENCKLCSRDVNKLYNHHLVPKVKGGKDGEIVQCCYTCSRQIHMLFAEAELQNMTLEQLKNKPEWEKYLKWISSRNGEFSVKMSSRVKQRRRR